VFGGMDDHVGHNMADMVVVGFVVNVLCVARAPDEARGAQQAQMVADEGLGRVDLAGDIAHSHGLIEAGEQDFETSGVTEQLEGLGDDKDFGFRGASAIAQKGLVRAGWIVGPYPIRILRRMHNGLVS
jgi:hypothetical protein